jgi:hypothetical protein
MNQINLDHEVNGSLADAVQDAIRHITGVKSTDYLREDTPTKKPSEITSTPAQNTTYRFPHMLKVLENKQN